MSPFAHGAHRQCQMNATLKAESEKLARSWMQHDAGWLRDYLVAGVEDPRINVQSILTRQFLLHVTGHAALSPLMEEEYRFSVVMNWLLGLAEKAADREELELVLVALRRGADNVEGLRIPSWVGQAFTALPRSSAGVPIPNYIESFLDGTTVLEGKARAHEPSLDTFCELWRGALSGAAASAGQAERAEPPKPMGVSVLEPACGSANDYRCLHSCGLVPLLDYTGLDLCTKNIENARALFPGVKFRLGNVFEIEAPDRFFDYALVHDLFEHLSIEGLEVAVRELCRVTRAGLCVGFFQMDEIPEHQVRPVEDYHWNMLSMRRTRELFAQSGFEAQVLHVATFLREKTGCESYHNPNAYTFLLQASPSERQGLPGMSRH